MSACRRAPDPATDTDPALADSRDASAAAGDEAPAYQEPAILTPEVLPALRTGVREPEAIGELVAAVEARATGEGGVALLAARLQIPPAAVDVRWTEFVSDPPDPGVVAALESRLGGAELAITLSLSGGERALRGALLGERARGGRRRAVRAPVTIEPTSLAGGEDPALADRFRAALSGEFADSSHPWDSFAAGRLRATATAVTGFPPRPPRDPDLTRLMDTTSGWMSIQEALQHDRGLRVRGSTGTRDTPIETLGGPTLDAHPFVEMAAALGHAKGSVDVLAREPLARAAPPDFWYARVDDVRLLLRLLDEADRWITPVVQILEQNPEDRQLAARYQRQLGLERSRMARVLGHAVVGPVAIVGSDPYLREGSDVTLVFTVRKRAVLEAELTRQLAAHASRIPGVTPSTRTHAGVEVRVASDPTGLVRQQRASFRDAAGDLELVSNSQAALDRVLDALTRAGPRLSDQPELAYMLVRDEGEADAFAYLSDSFIAAAVGPRQKILAARRQIALSELLTPGYAALLHGWLRGRSPASTTELVASGLLAADELRHADDGAAIHFEPGSGARSVWGRPAALTPLIDMPAPTMVTGEERRAYQRFASTYQSYWKRFIDPVAVRLDLDEREGEAVARVDVRILPLISATDYSDIAETVGDARVSVPPMPAPGGLEAVWAVGDDARLRRELDGLMRAFSGKRELGVGWLGGWVLAGVADRGAGLDLLSWLDDGVQLPAPGRGKTYFDDDEAWARLGRFPAYAAAEVANPAALVATLTGARALLNEVAPGVVEWGEVERHREIPIVRVGMNPRSPVLLTATQAEAVAIYYAQTGQAIALALDPALLRQLIDGLMGGVGPTPKADGDGAQFVVEARSAPHQTLWTAALWAVQGQANAAQASARRTAEILLRGQPEIAGDAEALARAGLAYFGSAPLTAHGTHDFALTPHGVGDPLQGSAARPVYGELPYPGSPVEALMTRFRGLRGELSFDREPAAAGPEARSLHTTLILSLSPEP